MTLLPLLLLLQAATAPMSPGMKMPEPVCVRAGDLPPAFAKWNASPATSLASGMPYVVIGRSAPVTARYPGKVADVTFTVAKPGRYQVGLSDAAWIDVRLGNRALKSVTHGHGPACTGLRKIVGFDLAAGRYTLHIDGMKTDTIKAMIVPA